jgi:hypothetical protein
MANNQFIRSSLVDHVLLRREQLLRDPLIYYPWLRPCVVKVLIVTDGGLNFGKSDFGLSYFIELLQNDGRLEVKFDITLAHLREDVSAEEMGNWATAISNSNRIRGFRFDDANHFTPTKYDQMWLFGYETDFYNATAYPHRNGNRGVYPQSRLSDSELKYINEFMESGRGVFATGDHGSLGLGLCGSISRVRSMRYWNNDTAGVDMTGGLRNDTNQIGRDAGSRFSDQSDDVPQRINPRFYSSKVGAWNALYPHPLLCSRFGVIDVMPDHPHEGECIEPRDPDLIYPFGGTPEYPFVDGVQVLPEIIAHSNVISGNTAKLNNAANPNFTKSGTYAHEFGGICAYDGHRAKVGRVVTDATWHHFINVNLIGLVEGGFFDDLTGSDSFTKHDGFLATSTGQTHLKLIKEYFINIGIWISAPSKIECFNSKIWRKIIFADRIMESALSDPNVPIEKISMNLFHSIGVHATDVLGNQLSKCQTLEFLLNHFRFDLPELVRVLDPWPPDPEPFPIAPWFDPSPILSVAFGYAIVSLRQAFPYPSEKMDAQFNKNLQPIVSKALRQGAEMALQHYRSELKSYDSILSSSLERLGGESKK